MIIIKQDCVCLQEYNLYSSSSRSPTRSFQQQWWRWWSSSGPPSPHIISDETELLMATVRFALVGVCYISEEHARLSGPPHHRNTLVEGTNFSFLYMCALSLLWPERSRTKNTWPGLSRRWYASFSCLGFSAVWWWWYFPGNGCLLMVALLVLSIWLAVLLVCFQRFRSLLEPLKNYSACVAEFLHLCC